MKKLLLLSLLVVTVAVTGFAQTSVNGVPEIDPGSLVTASALAASVLFMIRSRRKH